MERGGDRMRRKTVLKMTVVGAFICSFILALMYPVISASRRDKIHFLMSPNPVAVFNPPPSKQASSMILLVAVVMDSTYGSFTMALVAYETYGDTNYLEYHWYTDHLKGGETYAYLGSQQVGEGVVYAYDVTRAKIDVIMSEHQLNATVMSEGKVLFTVGFWADTSVPIESRIEPTGMPPEVSLSVEAYRPLLQTSVTGIEVGDFQLGRFEYIDTELFDSSLLP